MSADGMLPNEDEATVHLPVLRPTTRGECLPGGWNEQRPCPFASCRMHLAVDVKRNGKLIENYPDLSVEELPETCALDAADRGGLTLGEVGVRLNLTRERVRQLETKAMRIAGPALRRTAKETIGGSCDLREAQRHQHKAVGNGTCEVCGQSFTRYASRPNQRYCPLPKNCRALGKAKAKASLRAEERSERDQRDGAGSKSDIVRLLEQRGTEMTIEQVADALGRDHGSVRNCVIRLAKLGAISKRCGKPPGSTRWLVMVSLPGATPSAAARPATEAHA